MAPIDDTWLKLKVVRREDVAQDVVLLELDQVGGGPLPTWAPGAHLEMRLPSGLLRQYSLCGPQEDDLHYTVHVLREPRGRGGSEEIHRDLWVGSEVDARPPRNHFPLEDAADYLLIAGGIGVTPIAAMAADLERRGASWRLVYGGRSRQSMALVDALTDLGGERVSIVPQDVAGLLDVSGLVESVTAATHVYCCGPSGLLDAVEQACASRGLADRLHVERFTAAPRADTGTADDTAFEVELASSGVTLTVAADQSLLEAVQAVRPDIPFSCNEGYCGSCETAVLDGRPDHRGTLMTPEEHDEEGTMLICVGRAKSPRLVLDL